MTAISTLLVLLQTGDHASRPAASDVGSGGLYSCTTHSLIYQTDGSSWTTWASLGGGGGDPPGFEYDYAQATGNTGVTATSEATANTIVTANAVSYNGSTTIMIEAFAFLWAPANGESIVLTLYDGSSSIGFIGQFTNGAGATSRHPYFVSRRLTPSNASHTYSIRAWVSSGSGTVNAAAGGSGGGTPAFIRQIKV